MSRFYPSRDLNQPMAEGRGASTDPPQWEYLIAHHFPDRYRRTLRGPGRLCRYHVCARCTGQVLGILAYVILVLVAAPDYGGFFTVQTQVLFAFAPLPGAIDWVTQAVGRRESTNSLRVVTGFLAGATMADGIALIVLQRWMIVAAAFAVLAGYILGLLLTIRASGAWEKIIEEHFPGLEVKSAR